MPRLGLEYRRRRWWEHASGYGRALMREGMAGFRCRSGQETNSIHAVTADYAQGMLTYTRGGSPVRADGERRGSAHWQARDGRTLLLLAWLGGFRDSDMGWHIHEGGLRTSDGTSSSLAAGQNRLEQ